MRLTPTAKILILTILICILLCVGVYFLFSLIKSKNEETSKLSSELAFYESKQQEMSQHEKSGERIETFEQDIDSYFVGKEGVVPFIETLEVEAKNHNVALTIRNVEVQPYNTDNPNGSKEFMVLKLDTRSSWQNFMYFVSYIEHLPYIVDIHMVRGSAFVEGGSGDKLLGGWKGEIEFTVVKQK